MLVHLFAMFFIARYHYHFVSLSSCRIGYGYVTDYKVATVSRIRWNYFSAVLFRVHVESS